MPLHVALLEPPDPAVLGSIAGSCLTADASLHVVGTVPPLSEMQVAEDSDPVDWHGLDWWIHPGWRDFRDAITRERCLYFGAGGERDPADAPFRHNSVLVIGRADGQLPDRIIEKYPSRVYGLPAVGRRKQPDLGKSVALLLAMAARRIEERNRERPVLIDPRSGPLRFGRGRTRA